MVEPVQGEGGARALTDAELAMLRQLCDANGLLLIFDEIQCGMGRSGKMWAHEYSGVTPDVMCIAKALRAVFPSARASRPVMRPPAWWSARTVRPLAASAGHGCRLAAFDEISKPELLDNVQAQAGYLKQQLEGLKQAYPDILDEVRGKGLLIGIKLKPVNREVMAMARDNGLLIAGGSDNCCRLLPPLNLTQDEAREAIQLLEKPSSPHAPP